jgi:hypothetical protein
MIEKILRSTTSFEGVNEITKFSEIFQLLYKTPLLKPSLDFSLTQIQKNHLKFEIKIIKNWDTNSGCYLSEQRTFYNKFIGSWSRKSYNKIILRNLFPSLIAHEMAHGVEIESGINFDNDFRQAIGFDMKGKTPKNQMFAGKFQRIFIEGIKLYPKDQIISELFARFFEILAEAKPISKNSGFTADEVKDFFYNSWNWIEKTLNPLLKSKINPEISKFSAKLDTASMQEKFTHKTESFFKRVDSQGKKTWTTNVKSNADWQKSWDKHQKSIENK